MKANSPSVSVQGLALSYGAISVLQGVGELEIFLANAGNTNAKP